MSEEKRQAVEIALRSNCLGPQNDSLQQEALAIPTEEAMERLQVMGFSAEQAATAMSAVTEKDSVDLPHCLDWLCLNLPSSELPPGFAPGTFPPFLGDVCISCLHKRSPREALVQLDGKIFRAYRTDPSNPSSWWVYYVLMVNSPCYEAIIWSWVGVQKLS